MRVGIDAAPLLGERGGIGWHTYYLLQALVRLKQELELVGYLPAGLLAKDMPAGWPGSGGIRWVEAARWTMAWRARLDGLDLFHGPNYKMRATGRCGGVVTVHDLWLDRHPEYSPKFLGQRLSSERTMRTAWRARMVITVSEFSAREIRALYGLPAERIAVIANGVSDVFRPSRDEAAMQGLRQRLGLPAGGFILFVGGADPRKNHEVLVRAFASRAKAFKEYSLVLVGDVVHRFGDLRQTLAAYGLGSRAVCPGRLGIEELRLLYSSADLFVFPSLYEGFGMPVLEAMACGAPVITSTTTALPEVAGDAALLVDPTDPEALAEAMVQVLYDQTLRASLREKGFKRAREFTWEQAAQKTLAVYRAVCRGC
jgi:glycosyltransferase involved in cell wall biosynthesis